MSEYAFESGMEQLESLIAAMETGKLTLDESYDAYQKATNLLATLSAMLDEGEARIRELTEMGERDFPEEGC